MKYLFTLLIALVCVSVVNAQSIAFMKMPDYPSSANTYDYVYLNNAIIDNLKKVGLDVKPFSNTQLFSGYRNENLKSLSIDQISNLKMFNHDFIILHKSEKSNHLYSEISSFRSLSTSKNWQSEFIIINAKTNESTVATLAISTFDCGDKLETCSNISGFVKSIADFVQGTSSNTSNDEPINLTNSNSNQSSQVVIDNKKKKSSFFGSSNVDAKFKVVRIKEKNESNNTPISVEVFDKNLNLKLGDNIVLTRIDEVQIPGEKKKYTSVTSLGKAKIIEDYNKPLYTAKLIGTAVVNFKGYKDGNENYTAVKGEDSKEIVSVPRVMVIPEKINPQKLLNGEYQLSKEEIMIIGALKNKLENKNYTTIGFETAIKKVYEDRLLNENTMVDLKSLILESSGADFYVEFKSIEDISKSQSNIVANWGPTQIVYTFTKTDEFIEGRSKWVSSGGNYYKELNKNEVPEKYLPNFNDVIYLFDQKQNMIIAFHNYGNSKIYTLSLNSNANYKEIGTATSTSAKTQVLGCDQNFNFKIRNYATNEDVATDIKQLNTCGSPEIYKGFAESILSSGALNKINAQFQDILINGKKISVNFTVLNTSIASFDKIYNGVRLEEHIQSAIQAYSINYRQNGVVNKRMTFSEVYIPSINENNGQNSYPNDFALSVIKYLKDVINLDCEKTVIGQNVNINIK
jgi:hypothetical protein